MGPGGLDAPNIARDFYGYMFRRPEGCGCSEATRGMRHRRVPIDRWVNFVHIGA